MQLFRHDVHDLVVGENLRAADVEDACSSFGMFEHAGEIPKNISNADGLARRAHPLGSDHDGKALHEVAQNFERSGAGADDHRGAEGSYRDSAVDQSLFDGAARREMLAESGARLAETPEINDALDACPFGGIGERGCEF